MKTIAAVLARPTTFNFPKVAAIPPAEIHIAEIEIPKLRTGQVLVGVDYAGICGTQVMEWRGLKGFDRHIPHCLGHEGTGTVLECGPEVTRFKPGDPVVMSWIAGPGIDAGPSTYQWTNEWGTGAVSAGPCTTLQRHAVISENRLTGLPDCLLKDVGVLLGCAAPTGFGSVINVGKVRGGDRVIVLGCGAVGLCAIIAARFRGADVVAVDPTDARRELAMKFGASATSGDCAPFLSPAADVVIVATGAPASLPFALSLSRARGGRTVLIGNAPHGTTVPINPAELNAGKSLLGTWGGDTDPAEHFGLYAAILATHDVHMMLSEPYAFSDTAKAFADLEAGRVCRPIIDMAM